MLKGLLCLVLLDSTASQVVGSAVTAASIHEVTPRDGLQNEKVPVPMAAKINLIRDLLSANVKSIELCSFVREDLVPQMAGSAALCTTLAATPWVHAAKKQGVRFAALVPNQRGYETFAKVNEAAGLVEGTKFLDTLVILTSCTETHSKRNVNMTIQEALSRNGELIRCAQKDGISIRAYASLAFGCPFEGKVESQVVQDIVSSYIDAGVEEVVLADTFGHATVETVDALLTDLFSNQKIRSKLAPENVGLHMHDANGLADQNIKVAIQKFGISNFDAALGGCGGCNFIDNAEGNVATEKLLALLNTLEITHNVNETVLRDANRLLGASLGRKLLYFD